MFECLWDYVSPLNSLSSEKTQSMLHQYLPWAEFREMGERGYEWYFSGWIKGSISGHPLQQMAKLI